MDRNRLENVLFRTFVIKNAGRENVNKIQEKICPMLRELVRGQGGAPSG